MGLITVVYIEDNAANLTLVVRALEATGLYRVLGASDGSYGLELVEAERPALVLVDLDVPEVDGFEVARQIKMSPVAEVARIPVAAVSANVMQAERDAAFAAGCVAFIEKPFDLHDFRKKVAVLAGLDEGTG